LFPPIHLFQDLKTIYRINIVYLLFSVVELPEQFYWLIIPHLLKLLFSMLLMCASLSGKHIEYILWIRTYINIFHFFINAYDVDMIIYVLQNRNQVFICFINYVIIFVCLLKCWYCVNPPLQPMFHVSVVDDQLKSYIQPAYVCECLNTALLLSCDSNLHIRSLPHVFDML